MATPPADPDTSAHPDSTETLGTLLDHPVGARLLPANAHDRERALVSRWALQSVRPSGGRTRCGLRPRCLRTSPPPGRSSLRPRAAPVKGAPRPSGRPLTATPYCGRGRLSLPGGAEERLVTQDHHPTRQEGVRHVPDRTRRPQPRSQPTRREHSAGFGCGPDPGRRAPAGADRPGVRLLRGLGGAVVPGGLPEHLAALTDASSHRLSTGGIRSRAAAGGSRQTPPRPPPPSPISPESGVPP